MLGRLARHNAHCQVCGNGFRYQNFGIKVCSKASCQAKALDRAEGRSKVRIK